MSGLRRTARSFFVPPLQEVNSTVPPKVQDRGNILEQNTLETNLKAQGMPESCSNEVVKFAIVWGKKTTKKHKTWQGDGTLTFKNGTATVQDADGSFIGKIDSLKTVEDGQIISIGGKEVQIVEQII